MNVLKLIKTTIINMIVIFYKLTFLDFTVRFYLFSFMDEKYFAATLKLKISKLK